MVAIGQEQVIQPRRAGLVVESVAGDSQDGEVVEVQVVAGETGEIVGRQLPDVLAGLVGTAGLAEQHGIRRPPAEIGRGTGRRTA